MQHRLGCFVVACLTGATLSNANAQTGSESQAPVTTASRPSNQIEEVVVTANRVAQDIQKVPTAVTAFSGEQIENLGFKEGFDLAQQTPSFTVSEYGTGHPIVTLAIRGVGAIDANPMNDPSVSFYIDGVYQAASFAGNEQLYDIDRAEVLKGPQGTLFGRNSTGGLVQFFTRQPTDFFGGYARVSAAAFGDYVAEGAVGGPITDHVRIRLAAQAEDHGGIDSNPVTGEDRYGSFKRYAGRFTLAADLAPDIDLTVSGHYSKQDGYLQGAHFQGQQDPSTPPPNGALCSNSAILASLCVDALGRYSPLPSNTKTNGDILSPSKMQTAGGYVKLHWDASWGELTSVTGYENVHAYIFEDLGPMGSSGLPLFDSRDIHRWNFSQEIHANGQGSWGSWIAGVYYYKDRAGLNSLFGGYPAPLFTIANGSVDTQSVAGFGEVTINITSDISAFGGIRYTKDDKNFTYNGVPDTGVISTGEVTGRAGLQWQIQDNLMTYVKYSRGYKSGGFGFSPPPNNVAGPEIVDSYEGGVKSQIWDNRVRIDAAGFYTGFKGMQTSAVVFNQAANRLETGFFNLKKVKIYGIELEVTALPIDHLTASFGAAYLHSKVDDPFLILSGYPVDGGHAANAPKWSANGLVRYDIPTDKLGTFGLQTDFRWLDHYYFAPVLESVEGTPGFSTWNMRLIWTPPNPQWTVSFALENVMDSVNITNRFISNTPIVGNIPLFSAGFSDTGEPRTWRVEVAYHF